MNPRKRQAHQPLLPIQRPKQPRLALQGYDGGAPSPSEKEGIRSRWLSFAKEFTVLLTDTFEVILPSISMKSESEQSESPVESPPSIPFDSSTSSLSTPRQRLLPLVNSDGTSPPRKRPVSPPKYAMDPAERSNSYLIVNVSKYARRPEDVPLPVTPPGPKSSYQNLPSPSPLTLSYPSEILNTSALLNRSTPFGSSTPTTSFKRIPTEPSIHPSPDNVLKNHVVPNMKNLRLGNSLASSALSSQTSNLSSLLEDSQLDLGSQTSRRSSQSSKRDPLRRNLRNREHIFSKVHKASVRRNHLQLREEITRELYEITRRTGFTSGFSDFKGLLDYQRKLQNIDLENAPPPLRPFGVKSIPRGHKRFESEDDTQFLQRALDNAKATLNSPKPPKPFVPTLEQLQLQYRAKDDDIERRIRPPVPPLPSSLPPDDESAVNDILRRRGVVSKFAKEQVSQQDLSRLQPGQWLNDEVINFYGAMLLGRSEGSKENPGSQANGRKSKKIPLNIHYFSSFFWTKLTQEGYDRGRLAKWTKRIDIFSKDVVLMPVNHGNAHWTAAAINFRAKRFESYDSMGMAKGQVFRQLRDYVKVEHHNKKKKDFDFTGWEDWAPASTPQQENGYDCGVFTCQFMEALSRGEDFFNFSQKDMPYLRRRMIWEIGNAKLRDDR
ncbi:hypothetical protein BDZ97DRAFT_1753332 [Flammula alnicola]|nr:hypothetical protein BDZ97DRAFT_1753332 [Flammula alnicola]